MPVIAACSPRVTIVVLSYNRPHLLEHALHSIASQTCHPCEVLVIDNASASSPRIRDLVEGFHGVRLIANTINRGFTGGMNQGLAAAGGDYVYLTEDDIELDPACVATLVDFLERHPETALAGPVMWNRGSATIRCAGGSFTFGSVYRMRVNGAGQSDLPDTAPFPTMYLPGAMITARTNELRALGGFRSDFFMYGEDVELCARVLEQGRAIAVVPAARVHHHEPPEQSDPAGIRFHKHKNLAALYMLHAPLRVLPAFFARYILVDGARRLLRDWATLPTWLAAWAFALFRAPKFFAERRRRSCATS